MADLIYTANVSLDGFVEDEHGSFDFTNPDDDVFAFITDLERSAPMYLYGRRMYETMAVWETDPGLAARSELMGDFASMWRAADKIVYSTTLNEVRTARTRLEPALDVDAIVAMKAATDGHITVGGANLAGQAFASGLIDECRLLIHPVVVGGGKPALPRGRRIGMELLDERRFGNRVTYLRYGIVR